MHAMTKIVLIFSLVLLLQEQLNGEQSTRYVKADTVHYLNPGDSFTFHPSYRPEFNIFCYKGKPKYIIHIWQSVYLRVNHSTNDYTQYDAPDSRSVQREFVNNRHSWSINLFATKQNNIKLNPFNSSCIGIDSKDAYNLQINLIKVDFWKLLLLGTGILLFISADKLSSNTLFHYICGISFGISASFLALIYFGSKLFPKKPLMYGALGLGWTIIIYLLQIAWDNIRVILDSYKMYVVWYIFASGFVSFVLCYRWGPVENQRTKNLIKWSLQLTGLLSMFYSSHFEEAAMGQIVMLLLVHNLPKSWVSAPKTYWHKKFPPKLKLISNDEYYEQGVRETTKALEELKGFCLSPKCNQWQTALKLKNVKRFASFMEGNSHISDEEILEYETSMQGELTEDESDVLTEDEAEKSF